LQSGNTLAQEHHRVNHRPLHHEESGRTEDFGEEGVKRADTRSTAMSKSWTLEETGNGAGIVHIHGLGIYCGGRRAGAGVSQTATPGLDDESIRSLDAIPTETQDSRAPLVIRKKSRTAVGKQHNRTDLSKGRAEALSRRSARPMRSPEDEYFTRVVDPSMSRIPKRADTMHTPTSKKEPGRSKRSDMTRSSPPSSSLPVPFGSGQGRPRLANRSDDKEKNAKTAIPDMKKKSSVGAASRRQPRA